MKVTTAIGAATPAPRSGPCKCGASTTEERLVAESVDKKPRTRVVVVTCSHCRFSWITKIEKIR